MPVNLNSCCIAILVESGFEQVELTEPRNALSNAGAEVHIISPGKKMVRGWKDSDWGDWFDVTNQLEDVTVSDFDALVLPGGVFNTDELRRNKQAVAFVGEFFTNGLPVGAICHGPQMLIEAKVVKDQRLTSYDSLRTDLENAGAIWVDASLGLENGLITSRHPGDMDHFIEGLISEFARANRHPVLIRT